MNVAVCLKRASEKLLKRRQKKTKATTKWQNEGSHPCIDKRKDLLKFLNLEVCRESTAARRKTG